MWDYSRCPIGKRFPRRCQRLSDEEVYDVWRRLAPSVIHSSTPQREHLTQGKSWSRRSEALALWLTSEKLCMWFPWQRRSLAGMSALDEVLFQTTLGPPQEEVQLVTAPDITVPDCQQILRDTEVTQTQGTLVGFQWNESSSPLGSVDIVCLK